MVNIMTDIERDVIARQRVDASLFETDRDEWVFQINNIIRVLGIQETLDHDDRFIERSTRTVRLGN